MSLDLVCHHTGEVLRQYDLFPPAFVRALNRTASDVVYGAPSFHDAKGISTSGNMLESLGEVLQQDGRVRVQFFAGFGGICYMHCLLVRRWLRDCDVPDPHNRAGACANYDFWSLPVASERASSYDVDCAVEVVEAGSAMCELGSNIAFAPGELSLPVVSDLELHAVAGVSRVLHRCVSLGFDVVGFVARDNGKRSPSLRDRVNQLDGVVRA